MMDSVNTHYIQYIYDILYFNQLLFLANMLITFTEYFVNNMPYTISNDGHQFFYQLIFLQLSK
jgi:hypothetical protein